MSKYRFDQIAINSTAKKKPTEEDKYHYIGLEHIDSQNLIVSRWGSEIAPKGEKLLMKKGDVLFGKRRAYQKKVAIAPFDGIFSAHGMVLRPNEEVVDKDFFPMFISSDYFLDAAIAISVGSLSPTINWKDLARLEFDLPSMEEQKKLAEVLWSINDTLQAYQNLLAETDALVQARFVEMFGDLDSHTHHLPVQTIGSFADVKGGRRLPKGANYSDHQTKHPYIRVIDMIDQTICLDNLEYIDDDVQSKISKYTISQNDVYISIAGTIGQVGTVPNCLDGANLTENAAKIVFHNDAPIFPEYLVWFLSFPIGTKQLQLKTMHTTQPKLALFRIEEIKVIIPSKKDQNQFIQFAKSVKKSKSSLQNAITSLQAIKRCILEDTLETGRKE